HFTTGSAADAMTNQRTDAVAPAHATDQHDEAVAPARATNQHDEADPPARSVVELDAARFDATIAGCPFAVVDFWAPWCAPCRAFAPVFAAAAARHPDILFAKINTEDERELAAQFNIRSIPTLMIFRDDII